MPYKQQKRIAVETLRKMSGRQFIMETVAPEFLHLSKDERARAVRTLGSLNEMMNKDEASA